MAVNSSTRNICQLLLSTYICVRVCVCVRHIFVWPAGKRIKFHNFMSSDLHLETCDSSRNCLKSTRGKTSFPGRFSTLVCHAVNLGIVPPTDPLHPESLPDSFPSKIFCTSCGSWSINNDICCGKSYIHLFVLEARSITINNFGNSKKLIFKM